MLEKIPFEDLARKLSEIAPPGLGMLRQDLEKNFHAVLQDAYEKAQLVSREEFEVQRAVLAKTREKLDLLERRVTELERLIDRP